MQMKTEKQQQAQWRYHRDNRDRWEPLAHRIAMIFFWGFLALGLLLILSSYLEGQI